MQHTQLALKHHEQVPPDWYHQSIQKNRLQRFWHKRRFEEITKLIDATGGILLDIGSADGVFTKVVLDASQASKVIGIDVLENSVRWANDHWGKSSKMEFRIGEAHDLQFENESFDAVVALEMLEHVYEPEVVMKEIRRVLKPDGYAILLVPSDNILFKVIWSVWTKLRGNIWKDAHVQSFQNGSLGVLAKTCHFEIVKEKRFLLGMLYAVKIRKPQ